MSDPLGTGGLRAAALAAWTAHPARLREDANAEEDHARGHYRDRVVVELAQNAADAAVRAGRPGDLLLRLTTAPAPVLVAANTGTPLDAAGLASLASLRASAKRDARSGPGRTHPPTVGRFGVGFAAVRSVADEVAVAARTGAVHFSLAATGAVLAGEPTLAAEVARRAGSLPALRLPFPEVGPAVGAALRAEAPGDDPVLDLLGERWDTAVVLVLRDDDAVAQVRAQLAAVGDPLLLALPGLDRVTVEVDGVARVLEHVTDRWVLATGAGELPAALLASRPVEERERPGWQVTWAVPRVVPADLTAPRAGPAAPPAGGVVHAPTPTDEPCTVPALLVATLPLDPARRHVAPGPVTDALVAHAGPVWAALLLACRAERADGRPAPDPLDLVPRGWPAGPLDAALRAAVLAATAATPVLTAPDGTAVAPRDAVVLEAPWTCDDGAVRLLGPWVPALVRLADPQRDLVRVLGLRTIGLGAVVEQLPATPALLRGVCDLVATAGPDVLAELATAPVPLVDGRVVHGVRGLVLAPDAPPDVVDALVGWGLRVVHPDADHPVLERLGAQRLDAAALARHPVLRARVLDGDEDAAAVLLALVAAGGRGSAADAPSWWGEALLDAQDGDLVPARGLVLPGSPAAAWFDPQVLPPVAEALVVRWGAALEAIGVRRGLVVERVDELVADGLDGWADYLDATGLPPALDAVPDAGAQGLRGPDGERDEAPLAVADLDAVRPEAWPDVLAELARAHRHALDPVRVPVRRPAYTAWWLRHRADLGLDRPFALRPGTVPGLDPVPPVLADLDEVLLRALGGVGAAADLDAEGWLALLEGLLDAGSAVDLPLAVELWRALARLVLTDALAPLADAEALPALVAGAAAAGVRLAPTDDVAVADPMWAQHPLAAPVVVVPTALTERVADALDLDLAAERTPGRLTSTGRPAPVPGALRTLGGVLGAVPQTWVEHTDLRVDGETVAWWVAGDAVHADGPDGLACGVAHLLGWQHRDRFARVLADPAALAGALVDLAGDGEPGA